MALSSVSFAQTPPAFSTDIYTSDAGKVQIVHTPELDQKSLYTFVLDFQLNTGWKIYHKESMDAGIPPTFTDIGSQNIILSELRFPPPIEFDSLGIKTRGYEGAVQLPFSIQQINPNHVSIFKQKLFYVACNTICIPVEHDIHFETSDFTKDINTQTKSVSKNTNTPPSFIWILILSILAGFILNFMPCVLPVLSIKVLSIVDSNKSSMLYTSFGIISVFIILGGIIIAFKSSVGWGFQFQQGWFIVAMIILLTFMTLNLWGKFHIHIPDTWIQKIPHGNSDNSQAFIHGVVATLLATPCSAPLVGTALGFALGLDTIIAMSIFICMGIGMSIPYLSIYFMPRLANKIPKSGDWMNRLKRILSIPLIGFIIYLLYLLWRNIAPESFLLLICILAGMLRLQIKKPKYYTSIISVLICISIGISIIAKSKQELQDLNPPWVVFEPDNIPRLVRQNKTVVVDVTATWCITCSINKITTYKNKTVKKVIQQDNIVMMRADWTLPNDMILQYIQSWYRNSIPLTVVYSPTHPKGVVLPVLLSPKILLQAINQ